MIGTLASALQPLGKPRRMLKREFCFLEGDRADALFILESGRVRLWTQTEGGKDLTLEIVRPLAVFGEVAPALGQRREMAAEVMSQKAIVRAIPWFAVLNHPRAHDLQVKLLSQAAAKTADRDRRLLEMAYLPVPERVEMVLADMMRHDGRMLAITHDELASIVGSSRETVTKALNALAARGILLLVPKSITVLRPDLLGAMPAEGA